MSAHGDAYIAGANALLDARLKDYPDRVKVRAATLLSAFPALARQFRPVPRTHWRQDGATRVVACPCGRRPVLTLGELRGCEGALLWVPAKAGPCGRTFIATNQSVLVTGGKQT